MNPIRLCPGRHEPLHGDADRTHAGQVNAALLGFLRS